MKQPAKEVLPVVTIRLTDAQAASYARDEMLRARIKRSCQKHATERVHVQVIGRGVLHGYPVNPLPRSRA